MRCARAGDVLVELKDASLNKGAFSDALKNILDVNAVRHHEPKATVEIRNMDCLTTVEELEEVIGKVMPEYTGDLKLSLTQKLKMA